MRSLRLLAFILAFVARRGNAAHRPMGCDGEREHGPMTSGQEAVNAPANDNDERSLQQRQPKEAEEVPLQRDERRHDNDDSDDLPPSLTAA